MAQGFLGTSTGAEDPRVIRMAHQVKEVLPDVPLNVITRDLRKTPLLISIKRHNSFHVSLTYSLYCASFFIVCFNKLCLLLH